jgi:hypothetical protein
MHESGLSGTNVEHNGNFAFLALTIGSYFQAKLAFK